MDDAPGGGAVTDADLNLHWAIATWNGLTADARRWVAEAVRHFGATRTWQRVNYDEDYTPPDTRQGDLEGALWAAGRAGRLTPEQTRTLVESLRGYALGNLDDGYPNLTVDTPRRCVRCGGTIPGADAACRTCVERDAEVRAHTRRMDKIQRRVADEGLHATAGTADAIPVNALALDVLFDELDILRANATDYQEAMAAREDAEREHDERGAA